MNAITPPALATLTAAAVFLETLKRLNVDYLFGNAGTDFAAVIEAYATHPDPSALPVPITVPHENLAVAMAHGAYLATGRPQAVMVHVNVGTANTICGLINAAREEVPLILCAGRNPITETGSTASRNAFIHWAQEMFDQASMVREAVKWDYELRRGDQVEMIVERAVSIATAYPRGPVYLTLPRETFGEPATHSGRRIFSPVSTPAPDPQAIASAIDLLKGAKRPLLVTGGLGREVREREALAALLAEQDIAVTTHRPRYMPLSVAHPNFVGFEPGPLVEEADLVIVAACDVPWIPLHHNPSTTAKIIHLGYDPNFSRYPLRGFGSDLSIAGDPATALSALAEMPQSDSEVTEARRIWLANKRTAFETSRRRQTGQKELPTYDDVARVLAGLSRPDDRIFVETAFPTDLLSPEPGNYFGAPSSGGLGWGLGAALGMKLAAPHGRVIALVGDGAYMFGNPTPAHFVSRANGAPILTVILNNSMWAAVRRATLAVYPDSATKSNRNAAFTYLEPSPDYEVIVAASGGYGERVDRTDQLAGAFQRALDAVDRQGRQAVLNINVA